MKNIKLLHALVSPTLLYGCDVWGPSLRQSCWDRITRILVNMLSRSIKDLSLVP